MAKKPSLLKRVASGVGKKLKGVYKTARTVRTASKLGARLLNPLNQIKMTKNAIQGKGIVLPGSKYIGPGNAMNKGKPTSKADALAYQHDIDYDNYLRSGKVKAKNVYTGYSDADERLRKAAGKSAYKDPSAMAAYLGMSGKKLLNKVGLTKRIRDKDVYGVGGKPQKEHEYQALANQYNK